MIGKKKKKQRLRAVNYEGLPSTHTATVKASNIDASSLKAPPKMVSAQWLYVKMDDMSTPQK